MRPVLSCFAFLLLAACVADSPAVGFGRSGVTPIEVEGDHFRVYREAAGTRVEVHRVNLVFPPPSRMDILRKAQIAARRATGCDIDPGSVAGDQALVKMALDCG